MGKFKNQCNKILHWRHKEDEGQNRRRDLPWNRIDKGLLPFAAIMERLTIKSQARNEMVVVKKDGSERV